MTFLHTLLHFAMSWKFEWALVQSTSFLVHVLLLCDPPYSWGLSLDFLFCYYTLPVLFLFRQKAFCTWKTYRYPYRSYLKEEDRNILVETSVKIWIDLTESKDLIPVSKWEQKQKSKSTESMKTRYACSENECNIFCFCCWLWKVKCAIFLSSENMLLQNICRFTVENRL